MRPAVRLTGARAPAPGADHLRDQRYIPDAGQRRDAVEAAPRPCPHREVPARAAGEAGSGSQRAGAVPGSLQARGGRGRRRRRGGRPPGNGAGTRSLPWPPELLQGGLGWVLQHQGPWAVPGLGGQCSDWWGHTAPPARPPSPSRTCSPPWWARSENGAEGEKTAPGKSRSGQCSGTRTSTSRTGPRTLRARGGESGRAPAAVLPWPAQGTALITHPLQAERGRRGQPLRAAGSRSRPGSHG